MNGSLVEKEVQRRDNQGEEEERGSEKERREGKGENSQRRQQFSHC